MRGKIGICVCDYYICSHNHLNPESFQELCIQEGICAQVIIPIIGKPIIYPEKVAV